MNKEKTISQKDSSVKKSDVSKDSTDLAVERTMMAADRSLMAWERTALSLISFGFTIYKFLENSRQQLLVNGKDVSTISSPKVIGLMLIGLGILSLIMGTLENFATIKSLQIKFEIRHTRYALFMAGILMILAIVIFLGIVLKINGIS